MVVHTYNPSTMDMKTGSELQGQSPLHRKFYASLESMRLSKTNECSTKQWQNPSFIFIRACQGNQIITFTQERIS